MSVRRQRLLAIVAIGSMMAAFLAALITRSLTGAGQIVPIASASVTPEVARVRADGRVSVRPGKLVRVGAEVAGTINVVHVAEGDAVKKGTVLAEYRRTEAVAALREALALSSEAHGHLRARRRENARTQALAAAGAISKEQAEQGTDEGRSARARLTASEAATMRARAIVAKTTVVAPLDGVVIATSVAAGETLAVGAPLFIIADLTERRVEAEVDEFDVGKMRVGLTADVTADGFGEQRFSARVEEVPLAVTSRHLRSADPARPTDTGVLLVKLSLPTDSPLKLGQRVNVTFHWAP